MPKESIKGHRTKTKSRAGNTYRATTITKFTGWKTGKQQQILRKLVFSSLPQNEINDMDQNQPITNYRRDLLNPLIKKPMFPERSVSVD